MCDRQNWEEGSWDENGSYNSYGFEDYLDAQALPACHPIRGDPEGQGEYWMEHGPGFPLSGMLTNWSRRSDKSHWHSSGTSSASTSPYTRATLQGTELQPWCGSLFFPKGDKQGDVTKYDSQFLLQFQTKCTKRPDELPAYLLNHGPAPLASQRHMNTSFKSKHRALGSDRSTMVLDGMAQRSDLSRQQDLHVPRARGVQTYDADFLMKFQHMSNTPPELAGFELPDLPFVTGGNKQSSPHPSIPSLISSGRSAGRKSGKKQRAAKVAPRNKFPNSVFTDHPEQRSVGQHLNNKSSSPWNKQQPQFTGPVEPLQETSNRWQPKQHQNNADEEVQRKKVLSLLNKLTPEKFERLLKQLLEITLDTKAIMSMVIGSIFDKAVGEPAYATMYAELCQRLSVATPEVSNCA